MGGEFGYFIEIALIHENGTGIDLIGGKDYCFYVWLFVKMSYVVYE